jgi:hypothetical protein
MTLIWKKPTFETQRNWGSGGVGRSERQKLTAETLRKPEIGKSETYRWLTLIGKNQKNLPQMIADQERAEIGTTEDAEERGAVNSRGFPISAMFGNSGDSGNSTDSAACIEIKKKQAWGKQTEVLKAGTCLVTP